MSHGHITRTSNLINIFDSSGAEQGEVFKFQIYFLVIIEDFFINSSSIFKYFDKLRIFLGDPGVCLTTDVIAKRLYRLVYAFCYAMLEFFFFLFSLNIIRSRN